MVKSSDVVLLFTDGFLTGNIVNEIQYRRQGIDLIACCIPNKYDLEEVRKNCNGYFTKTFIDRNPISLSKRIVKHLIQNTKSNMKNKNNEDIDSIVEGGMKTVENALIVACSIATVGLILLIALMVL